MAHIAGSFLKTILAGKKIRKLVTFPGTDQQFEFRLLSDQDKFEAAMQADILFKEVGVNFHNIERYHYEITKQELYRACVECGKETPIAASIIEFRALTTGRIHDILVDEYNVFDQEFNPSPMTMSDSEFDKFMFQLKKTPDQMIGNISSLPIARKLIKSLVSQLQSSLKDNGST